MRFCWERHFLSQWICLLLCTVGTVVLLPTLPLTIQACLCVAHSGPGINPTTVGLTAFAATQPRGQKRRHNLTVGCHSLRAHFNTGHFYTQHMYECAWYQNTFHVHLSLGNKVDLYTDPCAHTLAPRTHTQPHIQMHTCAHTHASSAQT